MILFSNSSFSATEILNSTINSCAKLSLCFRYMLWIGNIILLVELSPCEHGTPLQYSCLENPMDGGAW